MIKALKRLIAPNVVVRAPILNGSFRGIWISANPAIEMRKILGLYELPLQRTLFHMVSNTSTNSFDLGCGSGYYTFILAALSSGCVLAIDGSSVDPTKGVCFNRTFDRILFEQTLIGRVSQPGIVSIDDLAQRYFIPDLVKMDIEGQEANGLIGADGILKMRRTKWIVETHGKDVENECVSLFENAGYHVRIIMEDPHERQYRILAHNRWLVAVPNDA